MNSDFYVSRYRRLFNRNIPLYCQNIMLATATLKVGYGSIIFHTSQMPYLMLSYSYCQTKVLAS